MPWRRCSRSAPALPLAGGGLGSGNEQQAFLDDAAKRLNVTPAQLQAALQGAYDARLDAAVAAGKLTKEQAEAMKKRSAQGGLPLFGGGHRRRSRSPSPAHPRPPPSRPTSA